MALIVQFDNFFFGPTVQNSQNLNKQNQNIMNPQLILKKLIHQLQSRQIYPCIIKSSSQKMLIINFSLKLKEKYNIIYRIYLNTQTEKIQTHIIFQINQGFRFISSFQLMLNTVKKIMLYNKIATSSLAFFIINPNNYSIQVKVQSNTIILDNTQYFALLLKFIIFQSQRFLNNFGPLLLFACNHIGNNQLYEYMPEQLRPLYFDINQKHKGYLPKLMQIKELLNFTNFDIQNTTNRRYKKNSSSKSEAQADKILQKLAILRNQIQKQQILYIQPNFINIASTITKSISYTSFEKILIYPVEIPNCLEEEIACIFNTISVLHIDQHKQRIINNKGRFKLSTVPITYTYPMSQDVDTIHKPALKEQYQKTESFNNFKRQMFVKSPLTKTQFGKFQKLRWENQILAKLRGTRNIYLPRFYNSNQLHFAYKDSLLIDYLPFPTLQQFLLYRMNSISFSTKINLAVHLTNAIRFLQEYKIAHLDLSSVNILVVKDHLIKIIDFGQAYSEETFKKTNGVMKNICDTKQMPFKYKPGRTFPFCPPETTLRQKNFTNQQDIYSLGVNFFHMIFGQFPLPFSDKLIQNLFKNQQHSERIFFAPQKLEYYGQLQFTTILFMILMKMLEVDENKRPFPVWAHLLFRKLQLTMLF